MRGLRALPILLLCGCGYVTSKPVLQGTYSSDGGRTNLTIEALTDPAYAVTLPDGRTATCTLKDGLLDGKVGGETVWVRVNGVLATVVIKGHEVEYQKISNDVRPIRVASAEPGGGSPALPAVGESKPEPKRIPIHIRRVSFSLDAKGAGELVVDTRDEGSESADDSPGPTNLAGLPNARANNLGGNKFRIVHQFADHQDASDFGLLGGYLPLEQHGLVLDRAAGTLVMTPLRRDNQPPEPARLSYPRYFRPPLAVTLDVAKMERGTVVLSCETMVEDKSSGTLIVNVSPSFGPDAASTMSASWIPREIGQRGSRVGLLEQPLHAGDLNRKGFQLPTGAVSDEHRISLTIAVAGIEPVSFSRLVVEGTVMPTVGLKLAKSNVGVRVDSAFKGSPSQKAGLEVGDLVQTIDGAKVSTVQEAMSRIGAARIGNEITFGVARKGRPRTVVVKPE